MNPRLRRVLIPLVVLGFALAIVAVGIFGKGTPAPPIPAAPAPPVDAAEASAQASPDTPPDADAPDETPPPEPVPLVDLRAVAPAAGVSGHETPAAPLGSLDARQAEMLVSLSRSGAGIEGIAFSNIWETSAARRQAQRYYEALDRGRTDVAPPPDERRYVLKEAQELRNDRVPDGVRVPVLAANRLEINGSAVNLLDFTRGENGEPIYIWAETAPGRFETIVRNADGTGVMQITRQYVLHGNYGFTIEQRFRNLTEMPLTIRYWQFGPGDLRVDRSRYMDRRRFRYGYLDLPRDPQGLVVISDDTSLPMERSDVVKQDETRLWPSERTIDKGLSLSWFASTNRYFALAVHPPLADVAGGGGSLSLETTFDEIFHEKAAPQPGSSDEQSLFTYLASPEHTVDRKAELALDLGVYAGPLDRHVLGKEQPYTALHMDGLILYQMSSCCAVCTFQWLAKGLLGFLDFLHRYIVFDWAIAIIVLVLCVRTILHPITKRSQVSMQRFGKAMGDLKPEFDKLQKKYAGDPKKMQAEQMRLMRERGVNPLQMLGCLPMFLQTPIWIALYAMLYFVFDLRQEPAFFGLFQKLGGWPFLADLSSADHCLGELDEPVRFLMWNVTGINVLPILMGVIFFVQQKYMSPPPSPTMTEDQIRTQKMMKVMMVVMFPLMLYSAPSGLTLYILTSSTIGIFESRYIRAHVNEMDLNPPKPKAQRTRAKPRDAQGRAFAAAMERMEEKRRAKKRGPEKKFKKRK